MKSNEVQRRSPITEITALKDLPPVSKTEQESPTFTTPDQTVSPGLVHHAPSGTTIPQNSAISILADQKSEAPHRRGRTAALRVQDVKQDFGVQQRKAFKPVVDLIGPLHEMMEQFKVKP